MTNLDNHPMDPSNLHQKSEELAMKRTARPPVDSAGLSPEEMRQTIHELRLQQIELESQNEELRTGQTQIESERKYKTLFREMLDGFALHELICDEQGYPADYRFLDVNPAFERMTGLKAGAILGRTVLEVIPGTEKHWIETYGKVALTGEPVFFENYSAELGKHFEVKAFRPFDGQFICIIQDISERKRAEEALRESQELLNTTQRLSKTGGWEWSTVTQTVFWTEETYRIHGFMPEEIEPGSAEHINRSLACYEPEARPIIQGAFQRCVEQGEPYDLELPFTSAKGYQLWVRTTAHPVLESGKVVRVIGNIVDITERKHAETALRESEAKFRAMVETFPLAIHQTVGVEQITEYVNPTMVKLFGYTQADIPSVAQWWPLAYPDETYRCQIAEEWTKKVKHAIATQSPIEPMEVVCTCKDGSKKNISWGYITLGNKNYSCGLDITERKQAEHQLKQQKTQLEQRNRALRQFNFAVSHELKTPLVSIESSLGLIQSTFPQITDPELITTFGYARHATRQMNNLLESLLLMFRVDAADTDTKATSFSVLVQDAIDQLTEGDKLDGIKVTITTNGPGLSGDRHKLVQIWQHLIGNAAQYMGDQKHPAINIGIEQTAQEMFFYVRDNGMGIEQAYQGKIFGLFDQLNKTAVGTGIGLTLVQRIVDYYGGTIRVESEGLGKGSCFYFTLPDVLINQDTTS